MAGVGGVVYDKDAVYIDMPVGHVKQDQVRSRHVISPLAEKSLLFLFTSKQG